MAAIVLPAAPLAAQFPNSNLTGGNRARIDFLRNTLEDISPVVARWRAAMESDDPQSAAEFFLEDGLYSSLGGEVNQGRDAIAERFRKLLPRMSGFRTVMVDYTASGSMAYQFGRFSYAYTGSDGIARTEIGTFVIILYLNGRDWKIRSYVERLEAGL